jgi:hypothetical protein
MVTNPKDQHLAVPAFSATGATAFLPTFWWEDLAMESQFSGNSGDFEPGTTLPPGITPPAPLPSANEPEPPDSTTPIYSAPTGPVPPPVYAPATAPLTATGVGGPPAADYVSTWQAPTKKGPGRAWIALAVVFCAALAAGILVFLTGGGSTSNTAQPAVLVQASAQKTLGEQTADVQLSGSVDAEGLTVPLSGSGEIDFVHNAASLTMQMSAEGTQISISEVVVAGNLYEQIPLADGGSLKWIDVPVAQTNNGVALGEGSENPASEVQLLAQKGASVKRVGAATIDGVATTEYLVVPSKQQLINGIKQELSSTNLPSAVKQELQTYEQSPPSISLNVWIDGSNLVRRMAVNLSLGLSGASGNLSGNIVMTFDNYGTQVHVTPPPPADVESLSSFINSTADRATQSNLTNALTEGKALYQINQSYGSGTGRAYPPSEFMEQAPEFTWTTGSCGASPATCISFAVVDVTASGDHQGLALAAYSSATGTCWYAVDVESTPARIADDPSAIWSVAGGGANSSLQAGTWFATSPQGVTETSCLASSVLHPSGHVAWAQSYNLAGSLG